MLMTCALPLYAMAPEVSFDRTALAEGALLDSEIAQRIKEAMEPSWDNMGAPLNFVYPVPGHPPMRSEPGHIIFVSSPSPAFSSIIFLTS